MDDRWLAGFFEGACKIVMNKVGEYYQLYLRLRTERCYEKLMEEIRAKLWDFGIASKINITTGSIYLYIYRQEDVINFLETILPHIKSANRVKQIEVALSAVSLMKSSMKQKEKAGQLEDLMKTLKTLKSTANS